MGKIAVIRNDRGHLGRYISGRLIKLLNGKSMVLDAWNVFPQDTKAWASSNEIKGIILCGALTSVNRDEYWMREEMMFVREMIDLHFPVLGICFGQQILGKMFGVNIEKKVKKSGLVDLEIIKDDVLFEGITDFRMPVSHSDHLSALPCGFELLATSDYCKVQAMKLLGRPVYGVQFHPCFDADVKKIGELGINDLNFGYHEGEKLLQNFFRIAGN